VPSEDGKKEVPKEAPQRPIPPTFGTTEMHAANSFPLWRKLLTNPKWPETIKFGNGWGLADGRFMYSPCVLEIQKNQSGIYGPTGFLASGTE